MSDKHIEDSLDKIRVIFKRASSKIESMKPGEKIPATKLANELADEVNITGPTLYPTLKFLFEDYPNVKIRRGSLGGIEKLSTPSDDDVVK